VSIDNKNILWGCITAEELYLAGIRLVCISPGSRSTPLVWGLVKLRDRQSDLQLIVHLDERNSAFFALGHAKRYKTPVALVCTSGTAPAHFFPAIIEANLSLVSLIILTADRPASLRDCGAPQTSDQIKLYGDQVRYFYDVGLPDTSPQGINSLRNSLRRSISIARGDLGTPNGAVHLNFPFHEPLVDQPDLSYPFFRHTGQQLANLTATSLVIESTVIHDIANKIYQSPKGIIIVGIGDFAEELVPLLLELSDRVGYPVLVEAIGLDRGKFISHYDSFLRCVKFCQAHIPQFIIRFGAMPTSKYLGQWLAQHIQAWEEVVIAQTFTNPLHGNSRVLYGDPVHFLQELTRAIAKQIYPLNPAWRRAFQQAETKTAQVVQQFLKQVPFPFEGIIYQELADNLPNNSCLYVANSMPTRDLDTFFHGKQRIKILANKGANGIDGTVSSGLGAAFNSPSPTVLICGDIAFYHDINTLLTAQIYQINLTIILLNNDGGSIFHYLPISHYNPPFQEFFLTPHGLNFAQIIPAFGCAYQPIHDRQQLHQEISLIPHRTGTKVLEIRLDRCQSYALHHQLWQKVVEVLQS